MRNDPAIVRDLHAAQHDVIAGAECVYVDALADAHALGTVRRSATCSSSRRAGTHFALALDFPSQKQNGFRLSPE
jgi:hypothetical protein